MRRSDVNAIIRDARRFIARHDFALPPFADWHPEDFAAVRAEIGGLIAARLGWDVTDFGSGAFRQTGLVLFTMRNGDAEGPGQRSYCEKVMVVRRGQTCPMHRHLRKTEDIINRGGAILALDLFASGPDGAIEPMGSVRVECDGRERRLGPGARLRLHPGESVTLTPGIWHAFRGELGDVLVGEVSTVNDDLADNVFRDPVGRFPEIEEDEPPERILVGDYDRLLGPGRDASGTISV